MVVLEPGPPPVGSVAAAAGAAAAGAAGAAAESASLHPAAAAGILRVGAQPEHAPEERAQGRRVADDEADAVLGVPPDDDVGESDCLCVVRNDG